MATLIVKGLNLQRSLRPSLKALFTTEEKMLTIDVGYIILKEKVFRC